MAFVSGVSDVGAAAACIILLLYFGVAYVVNLIC
jgi:hypothetical protein